MIVNLLSVFIGFFVGCLVAATGIGGGILLTPLLIVVLNASPVAAVGTALLFMALTKVCASLFHWRQNTVDFRLSAFLLLGSVPGAFTGSEVLLLVQHRFGEGINGALRIAIGVCLIVFAVGSLVLDSRRVLNSYLREDGRVRGRNLYKAVGIGFAGGFLVSATSIGSGSLIMLLLLVCCKIPPARLVGTDIFQGMILTTVAALFNSRIGLADLHLLGLLLIGSIPGAIVGVRVTTLIESLWFRRALLILSAVGGFMML